MPEKSSHSRDRQILLAVRHESIVVRFGGDSSAHVRPCSEARPRKFANHPNMTISKRSITQWNRACRASGSPPRSKQSTPPTLETGPGRRAGVRSGPPIHGSDVRLTTWAACRPLWPGLNTTRVVGMDDVTPRPIVDGALKLTDGRTLSYAEWGDPSGHPVLLFHGAPSSRLFSPDPAATAAAGVHLVTVDRPGYGRLITNPAAPSSTGRRMWSNSSTPSVWRASRWWRTRPAGRTPLPVPGGRWPVGSPGSPS